MRHDPSCLPKTPGETAAISAHVIPDPIGNPPPDMQLLTHLCIMLAESIRNVTDG